MKLTRYLVLALISIASIVGYTEPVSQADLEKTAVGAIQYLQENGLASFSLDTEVDYIDNYVSAKGYNLNIVVLEPKGLIVLSHDYEQEVIVHFSQNEWHQDMTRLLDAFNVRSDKPEIYRKGWEQLIATSTRDLRRQPRASSCEQPLCKQLITVNWNQDGTMSSSSMAYNSAMPTITQTDGSTMLAYTGCVATAMGILMNYHQYPTYSPISGNQYNWSKTDFDSSLATLMKELNEFGNASYSVDGTGMTETNEDNTLRYFGYEVVVNPIREADNMYEFAKKYIDNDYPLLLGGYEWTPDILGIPIGTFGFNHEVVADGYKKVEELLGESLYLRINFGWGGSANGWWQINRIYDLIWNSRLDSKRLMAAIPLYHFWSGNASIISYHGKNATEDNYEYPYGITRDIVALHPNSDKRPVGFFQWQVSKGSCDRLKIDTDALSASEKNVDITFGSWSPRDFDVTFENVPLPFIIGENNTDYTFSDNDNQWYVVGVAFRHPISKPTYLEAICTSEPPTSSSYTANRAIILGSDYKWNGNASIISGMFTPLANEQRFGVFKDVTEIHPSSKKPVVFFQWMSSDTCPTLTVDIATTDDPPQKLEDSALERNVKLGVKKWNDDSDQLMSVKLPQLVRKKGIWNIIQVAFDHPVSQTLRVEAKCPLKK